MTLMETAVTWARHILNLDPPSFEETDGDPIAEVEQRIARGRLVNEQLVNELQHHERADVAQALLKARERATLP